MNLTEDEVYINDGAKSDLGNLGDIFAADNVIAVPDPAYPAYVDANVIYGRCGTYVGGATQWDCVVYLPCTRETDFLPRLPARRAAYEGFITTPGVPHTI